MKSAIFLALTLIVLAQATPLPAQPAADAKPNIIFILADDLGYADLGCYGNTFIETPNLDRLASKGMRFTQAYAAASLCSPTRISIQTGKHPARVHLTNYLVGNRWPPQSPLTPLSEWSKSMPLEERTLPELLKESGYITAHIGKWHLGDDQPVTAHGFDVNIAGGRWGTPPSYFSPYRNQFISDGPEGEYLTPRLGAEAVNFIRQNRDKPFFLQLWHYAPHIPLRAPESQIAKYKAKDHPDNNAATTVYAAMVEALDDTIGALMKTLDDLELGGRTIVIFTSDNGGLAVREGTPFPPTKNTPLRSGKGHLYEGGIREPLLVRWPGVVKAGSVSDAMVCSIDFLPTFLDILRQSARTPASVDGISFLPILQSRSSLQRDTLYWHYPHYSNQGGPPAGAVRSGDWKLIEFYEDGKLELYNLKDDVSESNDLAASNPEQTRRLHRMLDQWRRSVGAQMLQKR